MIIVLKFINLDISAGLYGLCVSASPDYLMTLANFFTKELPQKKTPPARQLTPANTGNELSAHQH